MSVLRDRGAQGTPYGGAGSTPQTVLEEVCRERPANGTYRGRKGIPPSQEDWAPCQVEMLEESDSDK